MKSKHFESWLQKIAHTQEDEISCTQCFDLISGYVELELTGGNPAVKMQQVSQHLHHCPACREEYETLRDLRRLEDRGESPSVDDLRNLIH